MDIEILPLDEKHPNYKEPWGARWYCMDGHTTYYNRTRDGLKEHVERLRSGQKKEVAEQAALSDEPKPSPRSAKRNEISEELVAAKEEGVKKSSGRAAK